MYFNDYYDFWTPVPTPPIDVEARSQQLQALTERFASDFAVGAYAAYYDERDALISSWNSPENATDQIWDRILKPYSDASTATESPKNRDGEYVIEPGFRLVR